MIVPLRHTKSEIIHSLLLESFVGRSPSMLRQNSSQPARVTFKKRKSSRAPTVESQLKRDEPDRSLISQKIQLDALHSILTTTRSMAVKAALQASVLI